MKLNYPFIFEDDYEEIIGCGLSKGYIRFLLHAATQHHTFYDESGRVSLSDGDNALLESGHSALTGLLIGDCPMIAPIVVGDFGMSYPLLSGPGVVAMEWSQHYINAEYLTFAPNTQFFPLKTGYYQIIAELAVDQYQPLSAGRAAFDLRYNKGGGSFANHVDHSLWESDLGASAKLNIIEYWTGVNFFLLETFVSAMGDIAFDASLSWLKVVYFGER